MSSETWLDRYTRWGQELLPTWTRTSLVGAGSVMWGILTRLVERSGSEDPLLAMVVTLACAGFPLLMHHRRKGSFVGFQADLLALWGGFLAGVLLLEPTTWPVRNVLPLVISVWSGSGGLGGALVVFPDRGPLARDRDSGIRDDSPVPRGH